MDKSTQRRVLPGRDFNKLVFVAVPAFGCNYKSSLGESCWNRDCIKNGDFNAKLTYNYNEIVMKQSLLSLRTIENTTTLTLAYRTPSEHPNHLVHKQCAHA